MSNPSFENIDKWLFEYMEGNLSPAQVTQLESFLLNNPEFEPDFDAWQLAKADATPVVYPGVAGRKRKPIPFWVSATAVLTVVFVAGGLLGSYLTAQNTKSPQTTNPLSVASTQDLKLKNNFPWNFVSEETINTEHLTSGESANDFSQSSSDRNYSLNNRFYTSPDSKIKGSEMNLTPTFKTNKLKVQERNSSLNPQESIVTDYSISVINENSLSVEHKKDEQNELKQKDLTDNSKEIASKAENSNRVENSNKEYEQSPEQVATAQAMTRVTSRISSNYNHSFSNKAKSLMRKIARMTDNPIALTNSKDIYYHVPGMQTLNVNAATAGNLLGPRIQTISRAQWTGHSNQQVANELSFDTYVRSIRGGIGVQLNHSYYNGGAYNVGQVALTYSPKLTVNRNFSIEPAIRLKMGDKRLNAQNLVPGQVIELERGNDHIFYNETPDNLEKDLWYKDVALALNSNTKWFSVGFQMDNIGRHSNNIYNSNGQNDRAGIHYTANLGTDFVSRSKIISFSPYIMYQKVENLSEIWGGSIFRLKNWTVGGAYSSTGDYAGSFGLKTKRFMLTYNADMTRSVLTGSRLFSSQLTMRILMNKGRYGRTMLKQ